MRVAFVSMETTHRRDTAGNRRLERVAQQLADAGHEVTVFCSQWWDGYGETVVEDDVTYRAVTVGPARPSFVARIPVLLAMCQPDVVHATPATAGTVLASWTGSRLARVPLVVEWFGDAPLSESRLADLGVSAPDAIVTPSQLVRTRVRERGGGSDQTRVIPESIDLDAVRATEPADGVDVAYGRSLDESANLESLLLALAELRERGWSATVVGDGPRREEYERQAVDLRIDDRVTFRGECDRAERLSIYRGAHVFVQTAHRECFATELLWALACGCVGIVEYQAESSAHELIEQRERSFRVTSSQQIAEAIVDAGAYERTTIDESLADFHHEAILDEYEACYAELRDEYGWF